MLAKFARLFRFSNSKLPVELSHQVIIEDEIQLREKQLFEQHGQLQLRLDEQLQLFYKLYGTKDSYDQKTSYMASRLLGHYGVREGDLCGYLMKIFKGTLYASVQKNQKFMEEYVEEGLIGRINSDIDKLTAKGYHPTIVEDKSIAAMKVKDEMTLIEMALVQGLSVDRKKNRPIDQYRVHKQDDEMGLSIYTPKYLTNPQQFINFEKNKTIYDEYKGLLLMRVLARIKTNVKFRVKQFSIKEDMYTYQHLCIFQNQMKPPKQWSSKYKLETYLEWLSKFKFGLWKLVDIDNCMKGNSLIKEGLQDQYVDPVFSKSKYDTSQTIDIKRGQL